MALNPNHVADRFIQIGYDSGKPLTPIEVQKLLYFFEGWHLALVGEAVFTEEFQAWVNGPVIPAIYDRFERYGKGAIPKAEVRSRSMSLLGDLAVDLIQRVYETYCEHDPGALVGLTHLPGAPWIQVRNKAGVKKGEKSRVVISKKVMKEWFSDVWEEALDPANSELIVASPEDYSEWVNTAA